MVTEPIDMSNSHVQVNGNNQIPPVTHRTRGAVIIKEEEESSDEDKDIHNASPCLRGISSGDDVC